MIRVWRFCGFALVAFVAILAVDSWLRVHGFVAAAVLRDWGQVVVYGEGKGSFREFTTTYPPIAFALNVFAGVPIRVLCPLPPPAVTAALLAGLLIAKWISALRAAGYGKGWSVALTALVGFNPFFLYLATTGVGAMLLLIAVYWLATAYCASRTNGRVTDFMNLAFAIAFIAFVHPLGAFICLLVLPFLVFALPPALIERSASHSMLVLLFPLLFAVASFAFENALFQDSPFVFLRSLFEHFAAAAGLDRGTGHSPAAVDIAAPAVAVAVVTMRLWPLRSKRRGAVAALGVICAALGASAPFWWGTGEPASWRQAAMGTSIAGEQYAGAASLGHFLAARTDVLIDATAHPEIVAARGRARGLLVPTDDAFALMAVTRQIRSRYIAIPDPYRPAMRDGDRLLEMFPKLYERGVWLGAMLMLGMSSAFAGAWTQPKGSGTAYLSTTATSNDRYFNDDGNAFSNREYRKVETPLLVEYGMTDSLTGFFGPSLLHTSVGGSAGDRYFGPGYTDFGLRKRLYTDGTNVFSVQTTARVPGASNGRNPAEVGYTGMEYDLRALYGRSFRIGNWPAFADAELAWHIRNGAPPSEYRIDLTLGARPAPAWLMLLQSFSVISNGAGTGAFNLPYRYYKIQPSVVWDFAPKWSVQVGAVTTVAGRNSWREQGVIAGLWRRF